MRIAILTKPRGVTVPDFRPVPVRRQLIEAREINMLHPFAALSRTDDVLDRRIYFEPLDPHRTRFARDRDRIIHAKYFMLSTGKTQVFPVVDWVKIDEGVEWKYTPITTSRLFHALRMAQLGKACGRALRLNEDLIETIALAHDMGHVPFGHAGERAVQNIQKLNPETGLPRFRHEVNSLRVVDQLERIDGAYYQGLNLTYEVRDGIVNHCGEKRLRVLIPREDDGSSLSGSCGEDMPVTLEGCLVRLMDFVGYAPQDFHDLKRAGLVEYLPESIQKILGVSARQMYGRLIKDIITQTSLAFSSGLKQIGLSIEVYQALEELIKFNGDAIMKFLSRHEKEVLIKQIIRLYENYVKKNIGLQDFIDHLTGITDAQLKNEIDEMNAPPDGATVVG